MTRYVHRAWEVDVVGWTGSNFDEVKAFVEKHFGKDVDARLGGQHYGPRVTVGKTIRSHKWFEFSTRDRTWTIRDGNVLMIHRDPELKGKIEIVPITVFKRSYEKGSDK